MAGLFDDDDIAELRGEKKAVKKPTVSQPDKKKLVYKTLDSSELVHMNRVFQLNGYDDFTEDSYPYSINFYDFEVFMYDWMVVIMNPVRKTKNVIVNDASALQSYYYEHKNEIWCGYNSRNYDTFILKSILLGLNPKRTNDLIITYKTKGWQIDDGFKDIKLLDFDVVSKDRSLKQLEAFMGNDIRETSVPFNIDRALTKDEIRMTVKYCMHDVEQTIEVFRRKKADYDAHMNLISTFDLPITMINLTQAQLTANILGCMKRKYDDEFDLKIINTLKIQKYKKVLDWFRNPINMNYQSSLTIDIAGIPHTFGWGGLHGCIPEPVHIKGRLIHVDVTSYYPSIMIKYDFLTRNCKDKKKFKQIYDTRVELKRQGKKKEQAPYKIILNGTYGICKDKYSLAYDPRQANNVCVNGQLMLLDLIEHLEGHCKLIQSNTDGLIIQIEDDLNHYNKIKSICKEWEDRTGMGLGFDDITEIYQGDVNNYVFRFSSGKLERKGAYVMELDDLSNDLSIVNESIVNYLLEGKSIEDTIYQCDELKKFQKVVRVSGNYKFASYNGEQLTDKTFRVFASTNSDDGYLGKCKDEGATIEKFANTPDHCFIYNGDVNGKKIPDKLDLDWYVNLAKDRIQDKFGIEIDCIGAF